MSNKSFTEIASQFSLNIKKTNLFNQDGLSKDFSKKIDLDESIIQKTFYLTDQINSELIEIKGKFYLIGIDKIIAKKPLPLNTEIEKKIKSKIKKIRINNKANVLSKKIKDRNMFDKLTSKKTNLIQQMNLKNRFEKNKIFSSGQVQQIFNLKINESLIIKGNKKYLVNAVNVSYDRKKSNDKMDKLYERQVNISFDEQIMQSFDRFLNNKYKVKVNQKVLDRITNSF